jgi:hypothetical protein
MGSSDDRRSENVEQAAQRWWGSKRPLAWDNAKHTANPTINCTNEWEKALAIAVAESLFDIGRRPNDGD